MELMTYKIAALAAALCFYFSSAVFASTDNMNPEVQRRAIEGQYILALESEVSFDSVQKLSQKIPNSFLQLSHQEKLGGVKILLNRKLEANLHRTQVFVDTKTMDPRLWVKMRALASQVQPNYLYIGDPREGVVDSPKLEWPDDELFDEQFDHTALQTVKAWSLLDAIDKPIVVAVTDDGVDYEHEDLAGSMFQNEDEIPDNQIDDDGNGYVDDVYGWDFSSGDNNARPNNSFYSHGTHVAGIIAANRNNQVGVAGIASPVVKIMPLQFFGGPAGFTSKVIAETYRYAADNGANIVTTSYSIDGFVGDELFEDAIAYVHEKGLIHFNSAGNAGYSGPRRKAFQEIILVCSTVADGNADDKRSSFSNYGPGIDICAPGGGGKQDILSTVPNNRYSRKGGTSMASPSAAAVAALIWGKHPDWSRDQVVAQLYGTAKNLDTINPNYIGKLGAGRVDPYAALGGQELPLATIRRVEDVQKGIGPESSTITIFFSQVLDPKTLVPEAFELYDNQERIEIEAVRPYKMGSNSVTLAFRHAGTVDRLIIKDTIRNPFGEAIDGDKDGVPGGDGDVELNIIIAAVE